MVTTRGTVAVIIVGTNEQNWLYRALMSIFSNEYDGRLEVIYVDNNSKDKSVSFIQHNFPIVNIIESKKNLGFSGANNLGIQKALELKSDYLFLINPDTASPKDLLKECIQFMEKHPDFGAIGPLQTSYIESPIATSSLLNEWSKIALENGERHLFYMHFPHHQIIELPIQYREKIEHVLEHAYVQGAALFMRAHLFKNKDWFDTAYHTYYEEVDLCRRIRWLGYRVGLLTYVFIQHKGGGSTSQSLYKRKHMMRNKYYYVLTDPTWSFKQMKLLFKDWVIFDIKSNFPKYGGLLVINFLWLLFHLPKALYRRYQYRLLTQGRYIKFTPWPHHVQ